MNDDINGATEQLCYWMGRNCQGEWEGGGGGRADKKRGIWSRWLYNIMIGMDDDQGLIDSSIDNFFQNYLKSTDLEEWLGHYPLKRGRGRGGERA